MKKLIGLSLMVGLCVLAMSTKVDAAAGVRGAKTYVATYNNSGPIGISTGAAVLYAVILGTGAVTDFVALFDSNSVSGLTASSQLASIGFKMRVYPSATATTELTFDPPIQFTNGIMAANGTALNTSMIVFEKGRIGGQGY